jgi:D-ribose pyranose/furanose isomerase RbsD
MSELEQRISEISQKVSGIDQRLDRHEGKVEKILGEMSESLQKITEVMIKQEVQEEASKLDREEINQLKDKYHELDKKADLAIQSEESIKDTAKEIKTTLKGALKWGFGLFGSLMILLVAAAIRAALT